MKHSISRALAWFVALLGCTSAAHGATPLPDPTRPSSRSDASADTHGAMRVQAIILRAGSRCAIVDGHVVRAGDRIGKALIEEVTPEGVRYSENGHSAFARFVPATVSVRRAPDRGEGVP